MESRAASWTIDKRAGIQDQCGEAAKGTRVSNKVLYAWRMLSQTLRYAASLVPEIADSVVDVDNAMKLGYAWKFGPFELIDENGRTVTDADVITEPTLIYFGYTFCPDVCPLDVARNAAAIDILAAADVCMVLLRQSRRDESGRCRVTGLHDGQHPEQRPRIRIQCFVIGKRFTDALQTAPVGCRPRPPSGDFHSKRNRPSPAASTSDERPALVGGRQKNA